MTINELAFNVQKELNQGSCFEIGDTIYLIAEGKGFRLDTQRHNDISAIELLFISVSYTIEELKSLIVAAIYRAELSM